MAEPPIGTWLVGDDWQSPEAAQDEPAEAQHRRNRLWVLAVLPWLAGAVIGAVMLFGPDDVADDVARQQLPASKAPSVEATAQLDAAGPSESPTLTAQPSLPAQPGSARGEEGEIPADIAAAATTAVRVRITTGPNEAPRYVDHAAAASISWLDDIAVVRVDAVVLDVAGRDWTAPTVRSYGVAVVRGQQGAVAISEPWSLMPPPTGVTEGTGTPVDDPAVLASVGQALARAGYEDVQLEGVTNAPAAEQVLVAAIVATAPGERGSGAQLVWVHATEPMRVLGTPANEVDNEDEE